MRIHAFFKDNAPFIDGHIISSSQGIDETIRFLIDTGASHTTILDKDAIRLNINYHHLTPHKYNVSGVGGIVETFIIKDTILYLKSTDSPLAKSSIKLTLPILVLRHPLHQMKEEEKIRILRLPSLLGRDVINREKLVYNYRDKKIFFDT